MEHERLKELLDYREDTGEFFWRERRNNNTPKGTAAGCLNKKLGYVYIGVDGKRYPAHRLAWLYTYGYFPELSVDHINRNRSDNRIENLREVSQSCNSFNCRLSSNNTSGINGVSYMTHRRKYRARIKIGYSEIHLGLFSDLIEAAAHRLAAEQCLGTDACERSSAFECIENYRRRNY